MPSSTVIRVDQEVRTELQRRALTPETTPNSVLRRMLGLSGQGPRAAYMNPRVARLVELFQDLVGQRVELQRDARDYAIVGRTENFIAHIRPHKEGLTVAVRKQDARKAGLTNWDHERQDRFFACTTVKWHIQDGDDPAYKRAAAILQKVWNTE